MEANKKIGKIKDLGKDGATKADEFSETIQTAFDPPHFRKMMMQIFLDMVAYVRGGMMAR